MSDIAHRIEALERDNRRWKRGAGLWLVGAIGLVFMGQAPAPANRVIEAEQFVLKAPAGERRASLETRGDGTLLVIYGPNGATTRAVIGVGRDGTSLVSVYDSAGRGRGVLSATIGGDDSIQLTASDRDGKQIWKVP